MAPGQTLRDLAVSIGVFHATVPKTLRRDHWARHLHVTDITPTGEAVPSTR